MLGNYSDNISDKQTDRTANILNQITVANRKVESMIIVANRKVESMTQTMKVAEKRHVNSFTSMNSSMHREIDKLLVSTNTQTRLLTHESQSQTAGKMAAESWTQVDFEEDLKPHVGSVDSEVQTVVTGDN